MFQNRTNSVTRVSTWKHSDQCLDSAPSRTDLQLLVVQLHLLQLVPDGLRVPGPVISLQEVKLQVAESLLQLLKGVTELKHDRERFLCCLICGASTNDFSTQTYININIGKGQLQFP